MKTLSMRIAFAVAFVLGAPAHVACEPPGNQSKAVCENYIQEKINDCIRRYQHALENTDGGPDGFQQRQFAQQMIHGGCADSFEENMKACQSHCPNP